MLCYLRTVHLRKIKISNRNMLYLIFEGCFLSQYEVHKACFECFLFLKMERIMLNSYEAKFSCKLTNSL